MAIRPNYEIVPGMREQGKGIKIYVESDFAPLKAAIVGDTSSSWMPDPDTPENKNMIEDNTSEEFINYLRKHKGTFGLFLDSGDSGTESINAARPAGDESAGRQPRSPGCSRAS